MLVRIAAIVMFLGIGLGAFGAHGLEDQLLANDRVDTWETAASYHLIHGLALLIVALVLPTRKFVFGAFLVGVLIFSGSLYALALTDLSKLGAITPIGGLSFLIGWGALAIGGTREA